MANIRAYKLAEELKLDRNELVEKASSFGIELRSAVAQVSDADAALLREKLGGRRQEVVEQRVVRKGGTAVIRRRKRAKPAEPEPVEPAPAEEASAAAAASATTPLAPAEMAEPSAPLAEAGPAAPEEPAVEAEPEPPAPPAVSEPTPAPEPSRRPEEPARAAAAPDRKGRQRKRVREVVNLREQEQLVRQVGRTVVRRQVTADPRSMTSPRRRRRDQPPPKRPAAKVEKKAPRRVVRVPGRITVGELAKQLGAKAPDVQGKLMALGTMASINQAIDLETARQLATQFDFEVQDVGFHEETYLEAAMPEEGVERLPRPPIVTVMGHVDHGKTSLLDALRKTDVVAGEAGGITQHIGAYQVVSDAGKITFIDTPGHEAFTTMRARGANVTDIVVLVVAANDGIMPQTVEAIAHAKAAGVPIVVAVNKIDLPEANPQMVRQRLTEHELVPEEFGGDVLCVDVSATKGTGLEQLLEAVALQAEVLELRADSHQRARGVVVEAQIDKGRGSVATVLVKEGTLRRGDVVVVGTETGRVRAMQDERGKDLSEAGPSTPVQVLGLSGAPNAGDAFHVVESERVAKEIVEHRQDQQRLGAAGGLAPRDRVSLEDLFARDEVGGTQELPLVVKADVQGSVEALRESLEKLSTDEVAVNVIHSGVGGVTESDVMLARASGAIVIGFNVRPDAVARRKAEGEGVDIRTYRVIYEATDDVRRAMAGLLPPRLEETVLGTAEVRRTFQVPRAGTVAGCMVSDGLMRRNARARLLRDGAVIYEGRIGSLKRFREDAREVQSGFECGVGIEGYNDIKVGDVIEAFAVEEKPATL